jgi:NAD-dependent SIR2 family protein deacetylase
MRRWPGIGIVTTDMVEPLSDFVRRHPRLFVLTGAGVSTASGIPDYRDTEGRWKRKPPVYLADFLASAAVRRRYWSRSMRGWPLVARARPNAAHEALARLQSAHMTQLVTQNVDGLHQRAGSEAVIELHGNIGRVACTVCSHGIDRGELQQWLEAANPSLAGVDATQAPDGDAEVELAPGEAFEVPDCPACGGVLKPDVVFFGETVPRLRVERAMAALDQSDALLALGTSLMLYSGLRFCHRAHSLAKPIAAVNLGRTRADPLLALKVELPCAQVLEELVTELARPRAAGA